MALVASRVHPWILRAATVAVCIAVVGSTAALIGFGQLGPTGARLLTALMVGLAPISVARGVLVDVKEHGVTLHSMFGVLCIYLLLGMLFAFIYGIVGVASSDPFFAQHATAETTQLPLLQLRDDHNGRLRGSDGCDHVGRSFAIAEALIGQIYMVTVVAAIVGGLRGSRRASKS